MILHQLIVSPIATNCYLFGDEATHDGCVVDPGDNASAILATAEQLGLTLRMILLTHGHFDHTGAVAGLRAALPGVPVYLHSADKAVLGTHPALPPIGDTVDYGDGDVLTLGGLTIRVLHTPGHTPGSVCLAVGDVLFTGDTLFAGSMGRTDFPGGSENQMMASLKRLGLLEGDFMVCPGHEERSTLENERQHNLCLQMAMAR